MSTRADSARIIGLTGGIASGKSTVSAMLNALGARIVDADQLARDVVAPGTPALADIAARFGPEVLTAEGTLDRKALGALVFDDADARAALNRITHPRIAAASQAAIAALMAEGVDPVIYDAALIVENKLYTWMHGLIVVALAPEQQMARLMARDNIDEAAARARLAAQLPLADKIAVADYVIDNGGTRADTEAQVRALWQRLTAPQPSNDSDDDDSSETEP
ncbi:dephospho-CoA kinase [Haliangium ochraceum]|uniref:Dephospho-CoA kinase n=1 Tax=Haliangium ochraceum (strain DSM 14365 / JCM 11303 / SMP-2) TaxID=502025 RepID=D0LN84_HALO1|nr:dephospho-CoA kinase [Haliangium ochraceum]ACY15261.1 dephospho-CoA kinase [Haliangium ochraceum DSM 14365]